jgi:DNA-binding response OmpR family regulator
LAESPTILVIEDNPDAAATMRDFLELSGYRVELAATGTHGLLRAQLSHVGIVSVDIGLPGMSGIEVARQVKSMHPQKEIFFVSSYAYHSVYKQLEAAGVESCKYFQKPVDPQNLRDYIGSCIERYLSPKDVFAAEIQLDHIDLALYLALRQHPALLKTLDWRKFEILLADILETFGYEVELMQGTKDGGVDIFALRKDGDLGSHRYLVQAKRWNRKVGVEPVQRLLFQHTHRKATKSCLATTAEFTQGAWSLAGEYKWQLELRDYNGLREWVEKAIKKKRGS